MISHFLGLTIVPSMMAFVTREVWLVGRHPIRKRRRNWRVVKHRIEEPAMIQSGSVIYMHPDLIAKFPKIRPVT